MTKLKTFTDIGMPFHGRAVDGVLTTPAGNKSVCNERFSYSRQCIVVRHPSAPGASRSVDQQAHDTTQGHEWRDYALLCGPNRCVNGHELGLGAASWLYCDAAGGTWRVSIEQVDQVSTIDFNLRLVAPFGRIGRQRAFSASQLDTLSFSIPIPSWYSGSLTAADVIGNVGFDVYPTDDGSAAVLNIVCLDPPASDLYLETCMYDYDNTVLEGPALIGTALIALSGNGDIDNNGAGITGTITADLAFESGLVVTRSYSGTGMSVPFAPTNDFTVTGDDFDCPTGTPQTTNETIIYSPSSAGVTGPLSGTFDGAGWTFESILRKTPQGTVTRTWKNRSAAGDYVIAYTGGITLSLSLTTEGSGSCEAYCNNWQGISWRVDTCSFTGTATLTKTINRYDRKEIAFDVFGQVFSHAYEEHVYEHQTYNMFPSYAGELYGTCSCTGTSIAEQTSYTLTQSYELDGVTLSGPGELYHDYRPFSQNAIYLAFDFDNGGPTGAEMQFQERFILVNDAGATSVQLTQDYAHARYGSGVPQMPIARHWVWSWQPVTEEFSSTTKSSESASHSGTVWQYV